MNIKILLFLILVVVVPLKAQPEAYFVHYVRGRTPQHTITDILQDRSGFVVQHLGWLSRFDGYTFKTYHLLISTDIASQSSRIDHLFEDRYRNIWT